MTGGPQIQRQAPGGCMESVKRYAPSMKVGQMAKDRDGLWVSAQDFDRVSAENLALQQRLTVQDQRVDELEGLLLKCRNRINWGGDPIVDLIDSALKPTAEAEPQCLLCLDKKTVPGNIPGGFVKDCPDCCGEEG